MSLSFYVVVIVLEGFLFRSSYRSRVFWGFLRAVIVPEVFLSSRYRTRGLFSFLRSSYTRGDYNVVVIVLEVFFTK